MLKVERQPIATALEPSASGRARRPSRVLGAALGLVAFCAAGPGAVAQPVHHVDGIAAVVGKAGEGAAPTLILHSDVELLARISLTGERRAGPALGPIATEVERATLESIVGETLIAREAERVQIGDLRPADVARELARIETRAGGGERLRQLLRAVGASLAELEIVAGRRARVGAFLQANLAGTTAISDAQVTRAYGSGRHPFVGQPLDEVREPLRAWLARNVLEASVARWVRVLRARTEVRYAAGRGD